MHILSNKRLFLFRIAAMQYNIEDGHCFNISTPLLSLIEEPSIRLKATFHFKTIKGYGEFHPYNKFDCFIIVSKLLYSF